MIVSRAAIRRPVTVAMAFIGLAIVGAVASGRIAVEQYPSIEKPYVGLGIPYASTSAQEIERNVTRPVEEILSTLGGIERMYSHSRPGYVWISMNLDDDQDMATKGIEARELIESIRHRLPSDIRRIQLRSRGDEDEPILSYVISAPNLGQQDAWRLLDARVRTVLERVHGVNSVHLFGAAEQYVRIGLDPDRIDAHGMDLLSVERRLAEENFFLSAGSIEQGRLETQVRPLGRFASLQDIVDLPLSAAVRLGDVAAVDYVPRDEADQRRLNGEDALGVSVYKKPGANLVGVAADVHAAMDRIRLDPELADAVFLTISDQSEAVVDALRDLAQNGMIGGLLSAIVLFAFIRRLTPACLISATVPMALVATLGAMYFAGLTLNVLSLVGLMLAVGLLVDNSVVVSESIALYRRGAAGGATAAGAAKLTPFEAADRGVTDVGMAITAGTLTSIVVFVPTVFMESLEASSTMANVAVPLCTSIAASLLIATTLTPALLARMRPGRAEPRYRVFERLADAYERLILFTLRHRFWALLAAALLATTGWFAYRTLDVDMNPVEDRSSLELSFWVRGTIALERMEAIVDDVEARILASRGELGIGDISTRFDSDRGRIYMAMREDGRYSASVVQERILEMMPAIPNVNFYFRSKGRHRRYRDGDGGMGVRLTGDSTEQLLRISEDVIAVLERLPILGNVHTQASSGTQELAVVLKEEQASRLGITATQVARTIAVTLAGTQLRRGLDQGGWEDAVFLEIKDRKDVRLEDLRRLPIFVPSQTASGSATPNAAQPPPGTAQPPPNATVQDTVPLEAVASLEFRPALRSVRRENRETTVTVEFSLKDAAPMAARQQVEAVMANFALPPGYRWEMGRDFEDEDAQFREMLVVIGVAILLVYMLMAALFESILFPSVMLFAIVYSAVGVMLFLWATGTPLTMMAMIGMVLLAGIVVNNGIVLLNRVFQLQRQGATRQDAIVQAGRDRLRPIVMTACTTVAGLVPLAVGDVRVGGSGESYMPLARAIIGGLSFASVVTLLLTPLLYVHFDNAKRATVAFWRGATAGRPAASAEGG